MKPDERLDSSLRQGGILATLRSRFNRGRRRRGCLELASESKALLAILRLTQHSEELMLALQPPLFSAVSSLPQLSFTSSLSHTVRPYTIA